MRKMAKAAVALVMGCVLLSTSAFAMTDNINGSEYLKEGVYEVKITDLGEGESTIIVLPENVALEDANEKNILYINQKTIVDGAATYAINLGADFKQAATVYAGGTGMSAAMLGTLKAYIPVESVTLAAAEGKTVLEIGETVDITAAIAPATASEQAITWSENVAANGTTATFEAKTAGTFTVTATATADNVKGEIEITVKEKEPEIIPVTGLALEVVDDELEIGDTTTITAKVSPDNATDKTVTWSNNVTVAADGVTATFEATEAGTFTVTATAGDISKTVTITVVEPAPEEPSVESIIIKNGENETTSEYLCVGKTLALTAEIVPSTVIGDVVWSSEDEDVATVENGIVTAVKDGTVNITATVDGVTATVAITTYTLGDVYAGGGINLSDVGAVLDHVKGIATITDELDLLKADAYAGGGINLSDVGVILDHVKGISPLN